MMGLTEFLSTSKSIRPLRRYLIT